MKRKLRSAKRTIKKHSAAVDAQVDPGLYSDVNKDTDELHATKEVETREIRTNKSNKPVNSTRAAVNNETPASAAAKLMRALSSSRTNATTDKVPLQRQTIGQKEPKSSRSAPVYNKQELDAALWVIKKIMKMDASIAFNAPVDPIVLGVPDYFDIIDTPMDFGTICGKLERGLEYKNSENVFNDVQLIWDNCAKYNKKGSSILEHMKRVKANFMKQWNAAGLYKEQQTVSEGMISEEDVPTSPVGSTLKESSYLPHHNSAYLNQGQDQQFPPCCSSHTFNPQHIPYQHSSSLHSGMHHPGMHHHDMVPHYGHYTHLHPQHHYSHLHPMDSINANPYNTHLHPMDPINVNPYNPWANEASVSVKHSHHPGATGSVMGHPQQRTYLHPSSSSQLPASRIHPDITSQSPGHMLVSHTEPTLTFNQHERGYHLPQHDGDRNHLQHYQNDSSPPPPYHLSTSRAPVHQLNQSTYHQLKSSHVEGGRNDEREGNLSTPPPVKSTMNFSTKRGTKRPRRTFVDNNSCHQPEKQNLTPEQSSSMNNLEAFELPENADQNQEESSPSERLHSTSDSNISKKKSLIPERSHVQVQSPPVRNREEPLPVANTPQNQIVPLQSPLNQVAASQSPMNRIAPSQSPMNRISHSQSPMNQSAPLRSWPSAVGADDRMRIKKKHRGRGPAKGMFREIERVSVSTDDRGQPIGPEGQKLASFLGTLARNGNFLPLTYHDWRAVPQEYKESMWEKVQLVFDIDPRSKDWVLRSLSLKWKNWKSMLKTSRYDPHETDEERLADLDERVLPEQWAALVAVWGTEAAQKRSEKNKASRAAMKFNHATGRKSFARVRAEQRAKRPDGKELSRAELFILTRTRKDGQPVNPETSEVIEKLKEQEQGQDTPEEGDKQPDDILAEIIGPNYKGAPRCVELGSPMTGRMKSSRAEAIGMVSQANSEIHEMKEKMAFMEQTCAQMASQMASMMSMMSSMNKNVPDKEVPGMVPITSATSDKSTPHQVNAMPSPPADPTPQVPVTSGTSDQSTPHEKNTTPPPPLDPKPQARPRGRPRKI